MPVEPSADALLQMRGITKRFGPTVALDDVSLEIRSGRVLALIGENGAGKSTLMKVLSGATSPDAGDMTLAGNSYQPTHPHHARLAGVAMIYQELTVAPDLSIEDNILLGCESSRFGLLNRKAQRERLAEAFELLGLNEFHPGTLASRLSPAQQQLIEIARALVIDARVVIFDEPTSSLTAADVRKLFEIIKLLKSRGMGIAYISHFLEEVRELCDDYAVLRDGRCVGAGELTDTSDANIVRMMIGRETSELFPTVPHEKGEPLLSISELTSRDHPAPVSLDVHRGEIVGLAGLIGAGRTELLRAIYGLEPIQSGRVSIEEIACGQSPAGSIKAGMGIISEDRKSEGLAQGLSITDNLTLSKLDRYSTFGFLNLRRRTAAAREGMQSLQVKAHSADQPIGQLSGGNQQKVAFARVLHQNADVYLLDEPTRGIDVGTKAEIYRLMGQLAADGKAVLFVSSYLPELMAVCDTIGVMARGQLREVRPVKDWTEDEILQISISN